MTTFPSVDLTVYPYECDAYGHLNHAALLALLERARWETLARGPGMDLFRRHGVWPTVRKAAVEYRAAAFPGDVLRIDTAVSQRGTTSVTLRHVATRVSDGVVVAEAEIVFVMLDGMGRPTPLAEELGRHFGPRTSGATAREVLRVAVEGAELAVLVRGEGPPLLFIHGFPFDRALWRHQLAALSKWKRIAPDLRGAGGSTAPADGYSMARYADDLVAVLDAVGARDAVVCGLSMGGYILFELLRRHADRVKAVILTATRAEADTAEARRGRDELAAVAEREGQDAVAERLLPRLLAAATRAAQPELVDEVRVMIRRIPVPGIVGALRAMRDRPDSTGTLGAVRVPALVLVGSEDQITPPPVAQAMAAAIRGARLAVIPAAGHLAPLEQPLATSRALADFLESLR
ncbi:MAG: alpha/beta fold hydrolase [Candidatus Eiseniibacteriota bacterium]